MSQCDRVLDYMKTKGSITQAEAVQELGCYRLSARIKDLKERGVEIRRMMVDGVNRFGDKVRYAKYWVKENG